MKKLIRAIRLRLAYWHRRRFNKLLAKALGGHRYNSMCKNRLSSVYGVTVTDMAHMYEAFNLGRTHCDMSSAYPNIMKGGVYSNKDADKRDINILLSGIPYADTDSCKRGDKNERCTL